MFETYEERRRRLDEEEKENHRRWRRRWRTRSAPSLRAVGAIAAILAFIVTLFAIGHRVELHARRSELREHLGALSGALEAYYAEYAAYPSVGSPDAAYEALDAGQPYAPVGPLGVRTEGRRGVYWVVGRGATYEAIGMMDADGDGIPARWRATEALPPHPVTDDEVF